MSQVIIQFQNPDEVVEFTNTVERFPYNMDILRGSNSVADAKSLLGIERNQQVYRGGIARG